MFLKKRIMGCILLGSIGGSVFRVNILTAGEVINVSLCARAEEAGNPDIDNNSEVDAFVDVNDDGALAPIQLPDSDNNAIPDIRDSAASENTGPIDIGLNGVGEFNPGLLALLVAVAGLRRVKLLISSMLSILMLFMLQGEAQAQNTKLLQQDDYQRHFYIGAGIGPSTLQPSTAHSKYTLDNGSDMGSRLYGGLDLSESVSVELSLSNLGAATFQPSGKVDYSVNVVNVLYYLSNEGEIEHAGIAAYIKAGLGKMDITSDIPYEVNNNIQIALGAGVEYAWANGFSLRADAESFDEDASLLTVGLLYRFGKQGKSAAKDSDQDGIFDSIDQCPQTPFLVTVDHRGCELDSDKDGVIDDLDYCPGTTQGVSVDTQGCELDSDKDGVIDDLDKCPETDTARGVTVNTDGCTLDSDRDGVIDDQDKCPGTVNGVKVSTMGCARLKAKDEKAKAKADADSNEISKLWKAIILKKHAEGVDTSTRNDMGSKNQDANTDANSNADADADTNANDGIQRLWEEIVLKKQRALKSKKPDK